jgi:5-deoxy-D-glucuronate isomerase
VCITDPSAIVARHIPSLTQAVYYHRLARREGFAEQLVYAGDRSFDDATGARR